MDRPIWYTGEQGIPDDILRASRFAMTGIAKIASAVLGTSTLASFTSYPGVVPTAPASLNVTCNPLQIYKLNDIDATPYGTLDTDTHQIYKQGINLDAITLACAAPATPGDSINYLIQASLSQDDGETEARNYYGGSTPSSTLTVRIDSVSVNALPGTPAPSGTQTTPAPASGYIGLYVVTVAHGQTQILSGDINEYGGAALIKERLGDKISQATANAIYSQKTQIQSGVLTFSQDTGSANTYVATLSPALTAYNAGTTLYLKVNNTNTGASTANINGLGAQDITYRNGSALAKDALLAGMIAQLYHDGTQFQLLNAAPPAFSFQVTKSTNQTISSGDQITFDTVNYDQANAFNKITGKFQPNVAAYYYVLATADLLNYSGILNLELKKNGTTIKGVSSNFGSAFDTALQVGTLVWMNGTTDYITISQLISNSPATVIGASTYFEGFFVNF